MRVCITEKPSVAADIARILGAGVRRDGFYEGPDVCVTWTYGHLCTLKEPADYTPAWRHWHLSRLPMLPARFGIKLIQQQSVVRQFEVIKRLVSTATEVVNCGDAGQEGELIQRWVMQLAGVRCPVYRLWISSLTDQAIRDGFSHLEPQSKYDNLYHAGLSRAIGDWLLGLNATRLYSLKYGQPGSPLSVGRVQTPTLALIVNRQKEIENFVPENFWELKTVYREVSFNAVKGRYKTEEEVAEAMRNIAAEPFTVTDVTRKAGREGAPRLFDLTSLQVECNRRWGWSAEESLRLIQSLYEKKVTTYPRVDTTYLPDDMYPRIPEIMRLMTPYAPQTAPVLEKGVHKSKKIFDNARITDHHAIIPTGQNPAVLAGDERKLYHLIALRFIAAFYPDCRFDTTTVEGRAGKAAFRATGKLITDPGWRVLYGTDASQEAAEGSEKDRVLPEFTPGESGPHKPAMVKKTTQPPKYYTEGTLLRAMETAGRTVENEELRDALKENGIGRPSTRAAIIETLFRRHYLRRQRKNILATEAGIELIKLINDELLKSAALTGIWENKLRRIERGSYRADEFISELKQMVTQVVNTVLADPRTEKISR